MKISTLHSLSKFGLSSVLSVLVLGSTAAIAQEPALRLSVGPAGLEADGWSGHPDITPDGRFVAFYSQATNLVPGDTNGVADWFVLDRVLHTLERVSVDSAGLEGNGAAWHAGSHADSRVMSADGRYVVFASDASNLVAQDNNASTDVFVRDRLLGTTRRVSVSSAGIEGDRPSEGPTVSADGSTVAFISNATNLISSDTNGKLDVFVHELATGLTTRASIGSASVEADDASFEPALSADGSLVAFTSYATNLVATTNITNVFVRDRTAAVTTLASISSTGVPANGPSEYPTLSADGRLVAFRSAATNLALDLNNAPDIYVLDRTSGAVSLESVGPGGLQGNGLVASGKLSASGRYLTFSTLATNLGVPVGVGWGRTYLRDRVTGRLDLVNASATGEGFGPAFDGSAPAESGEVAFSTGFPGMVLNDTNGVTDVFLRETRPPVAKAYCRTLPDSVGCLPEISAAGRASAYVPLPYTLSAGQVRNGQLGVLVYGLTPDSKPWGSGTRCVKSPFRRLGLQTTGGNTGPPDCSGTLAVDFNARIRSGADPALVPGTEIYAQFLYRDTGASPSVGTTRGLHFTVLP